MDATHQTDTALLRSYATAGDAAAMAELIRRYAGMVFGVAQRITGDRQDAEDVAQACFLELLRNASSLPQARASETAAGSAAGWIHATVVHRALDLIRNNTTRRRHEQSAARQRQESLEAKWWDQLAPQVDSAIDALPESLKAPLILHFLQGKTQPQIAAELKISQPTVSRRLEQAVEELRRRLKGMEVLGACAALPLLMQQHAMPQAPSTLTAALGKMAVAGVGTPGMSIPTGAAAAVAKASAMAWMSGTNAALAMLGIAGLSAVVWWAAVQFGANRPKSHSVVIASPSSLNTAHDQDNIEDEEGLLLPAILSVPQVSDPAQAAAWYAKHLGFKIKPPPNADSSAVQRDECHIALTRDASAATTVTLAVEEQDDIDELAKEFRRSGTSIESGPTLAGEKYSLSVKDSDGNLLTFVHSK